MGDNRNNDPLEGSDANNDNTVILHCFRLELFPFVGHAWCFLQNSDPN